MQPAAYAAPVVQASASDGRIIVNNQQVPVVVVGTALNPDMFKSSPIALQCPFCQNTVTTNVATSCNCCACCLCCWTGFIIYACIQCCRNKDICCRDAVHTCPRCGNTLGTYTAC